MGLPMMILRVYPQHGVSAWRTPHTLIKSIKWHSDRAFQIVSFTIAPIDFFIETTLKHL